jgi:Glycosyltransferase
MRSTPFAPLGLKHRVLVIGDGPARAWFEQQLPDAVFAGQQTGVDLARALASADLFLNPSVTEAFGNVTLEAMACALPVVAADSTGATNLVHPGKTGTLVDGSEPRQFAAALAAYARDPTQRRRQGLAGLEVAKTMDWDTINSSVIRAYKHAIVKRHRFARMTGR